MTKGDIHTFYKSLTPFGLSAGILGRCCGKFQSLFCSVQVWRSAKKSAQPCQWGPSFPASLATRTQTRLTRCTFPRIFPRSGIGPSFMCSIQEHAANWQLRRCAPQRRSMDTSWPRPTIRTTARLVVSPKLQMLCGAIRRRSCQWTNIVVIQRECLEVRETQRESRWAAKTA